MSTQGQPTFERREAGVLVDRLREPRRFVQVVAGARQVGKSTLVTQVLSRLDVPNGGPKLIAGGGLGQPIRIRDRQVWLAASKGFES